MRSNRSIPKAVVIPELAYRDVGEAADWLSAAFGFGVRLRIANHRIQMNVGDGAVVLIELRGETAKDHSIMVRVEDANLHHDIAKRFGAKIVRPPTDYPFGERQYTVEDLGGHIWTFSQSIADVEPESWGGTSVSL